MKELDFKKRKEPQIKYNLAMAKADLPGIDKAIQDYEEEIRTQEENEK